MKTSDVDKIRAFNRFYTNHIGLLDQYIYHSRYSLPEVRVLFELYHTRSLTAKELTTLISIDKGFLSRILRNFEKKGLIKRLQSKEDGRATHISLTPAGRKEYQTLDKEADDQVLNILRSLTARDCDKLVKSMASIKMILTKKKI